MTPAKCPNPSCPFLFDPSQVPPGAVIACPRCGLRFTLGPSAPQYGAPAPPLPADDFGLGLTDERPNLDDMPTEEGPRSRRRGSSHAAEPPRRHQPGGSGAGKLIVYSVIAVLLVCGAIVGSLYLMSRNKTRDLGESRKTEVVLDRFHLGYTPPGENWVADDELKRMFKATVVAMESRDPAGWIIVDAKPMAYTPTEAELHDMVRATLLPNFGDLKDHLDEEPATLSGVPGKRYTFESLYRHPRSGEDVKGEVYAVGFQSTAYFVYSFAPEKRVGDVAQTFVDFRAGIRLIPQAGKADQVGYKKVFRTNRGGYTLTATESLWKELANAASQDENADLWLTGTVRVAGGGIRPDPATVIVFALEKGGNPKAAAEEYLKKSIVFDRPGFPLSLTELTDDLTGDDPPAGPPDPTAAVSRYEVRYENGGSDSRKYVAVAAFETDTKLFVAVGYCVLKQRKSWEKRLVQIVGSLAPGS